VGRLYLCSFVFAVNLIIVFLQNISERHGVHPSIAPTSRENMQIRYDDGAWSKSHRYLTRCRGPTQSFRPTELQGDLPTGSTLDLLRDDRKTKSSSFPPPVHRFVAALVPHVRNTLSGPDEFDELSRVVRDAYPGAQLGTPALEHDDTVIKPPPGIVSILCRL
jgi:hypothetical protein